jgi:hypothetical protein
MRKQLPEYFAIKWSDNPLWKDYIKWLNETYDVTLNGTATKSYYGFAGKRTDTFFMYSTSLSDFKNPVTELTLEQWDNIVNKKDEFVLPERWYTIPRNKEETQLLLEFTNRTCDYNDKFNYYISTHIPTFKGLTFVDGYLKIDGSLNDFKEITFEQFKKYVLKQDNMKEIIGYKVKDKKYLPFANKLHDYSANQPFNFIYKIHTSEFSIKNFKAAGVLDIWFEPVYEEDKTLPKINGYDGVLEKSYVVYGCAKFNIKYIEELHGLINRNKVLLGNKDIASIKLDSGVEITIEQIKEIYEYIKSKN